MNITMPSLLALVVLALTGSLLASAAPTTGKTLENLQAAFNGESNANAKYLAFAKKADEEGYTQVASLFRAAARAEEVHFKAHAEVIKAMGAEPKADIQPADVKTTRENLQAAIKGESYERDTMYPDFITVARAERNGAATKTFNLAKAAEAEHAKLYQQALDNLESWKGGTRDFYVCTVCGWTTTVLPGEKCPSCFNPKEKFVLVK